MISIDVFMLGMFKGHEDILDLNDHLGMDVGAANHLAELLKADLAIIVLGSFSIFSVGYYLKVVWR